MFANLLLSINSIMNHLSSEVDPVEYAQKFTGSIKGTRYLMFRDLPELIKEHVKGTLTLDYGCGPGESARFLKAHGLTVEGMDINGSMIEQAKQKEPAAVYEVINSGEIPRESNYYDFVNSTCVLIHAHTKEELRKIGREILRVLKVGGTFIAVVNSNKTFKYEWLTGSVDFEENKYLVSGVPAKYFCKNGNFFCMQTYWTEEDYCEALEEVGLKIVQVHKPLGKDTDSWDWINEKEHHPYIMIVCQKVTEFS